MPVSLVVGDVSTFRKYVKNIGRAYQKRSVAMIQLCRLFLEISPGKPDQTDALKSLFDTVESALKSAVKAGKGRSDVADEAFATAEEQLDLYAVLYHAREQDVLGDVHDIIEDAAQKDSQIMKTYNRLSSRLGLSKADTPRSSSLVKVRFQILHSPTDRHLAPIVTCELGPEVNVSELLWTFSRLPEDQRVSLKQNPHFYLSRELSDRPLAYDDKFVLKPLKDLKPEKDLVVLILSDRNGQIYFDYEKFSKTYGNIWKPHNTIILKDLQGTLEAANQISPKINGEVCIWQRGGRPDGDLTEWTEVLDQALHAPDADWLIRSGTSRDEAFDIEVTGGWERCSPIKEPEPAPVFGLGNSVAPAPSREDLSTVLEDAPGFDFGSGSLAPTLDSSGQSSYYSRDDTGPSDGTVDSSAEETQSNVEKYSPSVDDAVSSDPEATFSLDGGVQVEAAVPSPVSTPHAVIELLDPPIESGPDAGGSVFVPDRIITIKKTHLLVEIVHVPPRPTPPPPEAPTPPVSNDEAVAGDRGSILDRTTPLSESTHPQLQLTHPPAQTLPSPTPPTHASNAQTLNIVTPLEHARRQVEAVHLPAQPVLSPPLPPTRPTESKTAPKSDAVASPKLTPASKRTPQQVEAVRPPVQPVPVHPGPKVSVPPMIEQASVSSAAVSSAPEHVRPRVEPLHSLNQSVPTSEALTPSLSNRPTTASDAPASDRVSAVSKSARPRVEIVHPPVRLVPAPLSVTSRAGRESATAGSASTLSKTIPAPERTRPLAAEAIRPSAEVIRPPAEAIRPLAQLTRPVPKSLAPLGNASAAAYPTLAPSGTRPQAATVPRPVQAVHPTPRSSALPVRSGPVPAGSVPPPNLVRLSSERARPQVGAGRTPSLVPRAPPESRVALIGNTPAGGAPGPDTKEVLRPRIKSHPRKMVTPVGQRRSVVAPAPMVMQPTTPPQGQPKSPPVQQPTTRLAPQKGNSLPLQDRSTGMSSASSLPTAQDKPKVRLTPTPAPAVPTAPLAVPPATPPGAAPPSRVGKMASVPAPTMLENGPRISNTDGLERSLQPRVVPEQMAPRPAVRPPALLPMHPAEQSATGPPPNSSSSTPTIRQDRATTVLPDSSPQKRADPVSIPGGWDEIKADSTETTIVTIPAPASKAAIAAAPVGNILPTPATSNVPSPTPSTSKAKDPIREPRLLTVLPEYIAPQVTVRLPAQPVTLPKQQTEPVTTSVLNSDPVAMTHHGETTKPSSHGSRTETLGVVSGTETPQGEPKLHSTTATVLPEQQVNSVNIVPEPVLRSSARRITSRIKTKDLINRHKPQNANDVRPPSIAQSVGTPTLSKSPMLDTSQPTPAKPDPNRIDSGIELWDYSEPLGARSDRQKGFNIPANGDNKSAADGAAALMLPMKLPAVLDSADGSSLPLPHPESLVSISESPEPPTSIPPPPSSPPEPVLAPAPNTAESLQTEPPASTPPGRGGGTFLTRKPQASFQTAIQGSAAGYPETSTPPRSSTPSSMTHATTAATSTQVTLVTPATSFHQVSSLGMKAQPRSWFRRNVIDPFKTKLGLAPS